jgi:hypothetical protein
MQDIRFATLTCDSHLAEKLTIYLLIVICARSSPGVFSGSAPSALGSSLIEAASNTGFGVGALVAQPGNPQRQGAQKGTQHVPHNHLTPSGPLGWLTAPTPPNNRSSCIFFRETFSLSRSFPPRSKDRPTFAASRY